jgi:hypothetical protein
MGTSEVSGCCYKLGGGRREQGKGERGKGKRERGKGKGEKGKGKRERGKGKRGKAAVPAVVHELRITVTISQ